MVKQIFFDLGLTLVHNDMPHRYQTALKKSGMIFRFPRQKEHIIWRTNTL